MKRYAVTGAFGYTGRFIAHELLNADLEVITLTNSPARQDLLPRPIETFPLDFQNRIALTKSLEGVKTLFNTYWVRFNHRRFNHQDAVANTKRLFQAAKDAGVERIVHTSITNPDKESPFEYFRGKAELEEALATTGVSYSIVRPAVFFGEQDILINNIAWALRHLPVMGVFGGGSYRIQPIHVKDFAKLAIAEGEMIENHVIDAVGPESYTYRGLIEMLSEILKCKKRIICVSPALGLLAGRLLGLLTGDVVITKEEIGGLMAGLLAVNTQPKGKISLKAWAEEHKHLLGVSYANELKRR